MIDQLTIANIKLWHIEDERREFVKNPNIDIEKPIFLLNQIATVNKERNTLIDKINAAIKVLIDKAKDNDTDFILKAEDLLGIGKNKFYKTENYD